MSSQHSVTNQLHIKSSIAMLPKYGSSTSAANHHSTPDPYNFTDEETRIMSSPLSNPSVISLAMCQQNIKSSSNEALLEINYNQVPANVDNHHQQQEVIDSRVQEPHVDINTSFNQVSPVEHSIRAESHNVVMLKKRGRKKKSMNNTTGSSAKSMVDEIILILPKERKKHDRFNGMSEEDVSKRTLPDHLANNLDIIIIGINPGLFAAYKGHHYAGPGNHFWKCLYLSGLTHQQMTAEEDYKLLKFGIGLTNMVERATKGSADLTRKEIKEGSKILLDKLKRYRPKIAVFNGKLIFEVFSGKKDFKFGRQQECVEGTDTYMWVMPSSSARCAQLPRAADKVPFYTALKQFRDWLNGILPQVDDMEYIFNNKSSERSLEPQTSNLTGEEKTDIEGKNNEKRIKQNCLEKGERKEKISKTKNEGRKTEEDKEVTIKDENDEDIEKEPEESEENLLESEEKAENYVKRQADGPEGQQEQEAVEVKEMKDPLISTDCISVVSDTNFSSLEFFNSQNQNNFDFIEKSNITTKNTSPDTESKRTLENPHLVNPSNEFFNRENVFYMNEFNTNTDPNPNICKKAIHNSEFIYPCDHHPEKKKRGRPKKIRDTEEEKANVTQKIRNKHFLVHNNNVVNLPLMGDNREMPKKKRGRPKKIKSDQVSNNLNLNTNGAILNCRNMALQFKANNNISDYSIQEENITKINNNLNKQSYNTNDLNDLNDDKSELLSQHQHPESMRSPNTVSSYWALGINALSTSPNYNNSNLNLVPKTSNNETEQLFSHHQKQQHNQFTEPQKYATQHHVEHQMSIPFSAYMHSPTTHLQQSSESPHCGSSHSDLSTDISAAISTDYLNDSQSASSPVLGFQADYDRSITNSNDQQERLSIHHVKNYQNAYQSPGGCNQPYLENHISNSQNKITERESEEPQANTNCNENNNINYMAPFQADLSDLQHVKNVQQKRNIHISDLTSKSLSELESLVDQIRTVSDDNNSLNSPVMGIKSDSNEDFPTPSSIGRGNSSSNSGIECTYLPSYSNYNSPISPTPPSVAVSVTSMPLPLHTTSVQPFQCPKDPIPPRINANNNNCNSTTTNFSFSNIQRNNYTSSNSYQTNFMAAVSGATASSMYMEPQVSATSSIYHHPYVQHSDYDTYGSVGPHHPSSTLHMVNPNYSYTYANESSYFGQTLHHPCHSSTSSYLTSPPSILIESNRIDRIKTDIGYGGY